MRRINTLEDLKSERKRLLYRRMNLEREIKADFQEIKESLEPVNFLTGGARKTLGSGKNHLLGDSIGMATNFLTKAALKNSGLLPRILVPLVVKTVTSSLVEKNKSRIFNWIGSIAARVSGKRPAHQ
jgi:hypothetical protein